MTNRLRRTTFALGLVMLAGGCKDYLTGPVLTVSPNSPSTSGLVQPLLGPSMIADDLVAAIPQTLALLDG